MTPAPKPMTAVADILRWDLALPGCGAAATDSRDATKRHGFTRLVRNNIQRKIQIGRESEAARLALQRQCFGGGAISAPPVLSTLLQHLHPSSNDNDDGDEGEAEYQRRVRAERRAAQAAAAAAEAARRSDEAHRRALPVRAAALHERGEVERQRAAIARDRRYESELAFLHIAESEAERHTADVNRAVRWARIVLAHAAARTFFQAAFMRLTIDAPAEASSTTTAPSAFASHLRTPRGGSNSSAPSRAPRSPIGGHLSAAALPLYGGFALFSVDTPRPALPPRAHLRRWRLVRFFVLVTVTFRRVRRTRAVAAILSLLRFARRASRFAAAFRKFRLKVITCQAIARGFVVALRERRRMIALRMAGAEREYAASVAAAFDPDGSIRRYLAVPTDGDMAGVMTTVAALLSSPAAGTVGAKRRGSVTPQAASSPGAAFLPKPVHTTPQTNGGIDVPEFTFGTPAPLELDAPSPGGAAAGRRDTVQPTSPAAVTSPLASVARRSLVLDSSTWRPLNAERQARQTNDAGAIAAALQAAASTSPVSAAVRSPSLFRSAADSAAHTLAESAVRVLIPFVLTTSGLDRPKTYLDATAIVVDRFVAELRALNLAHATAHSAALRLWRFERHDAEVQRRRGFVVRLPPRPPPAVVRVLIPTHVVEAAVKALLDDAILAAAGPVARVRLPPLSDAHVRAVASHEAEVTAARRRLQQLEAEKRRAAEEQRKRLAVVPVVAFPCLDRRATLDLTDEHRALLPRRRRSTKN